MRRIAIPIALAAVAVLSVAFVAMGAVSSLFGALLVGITRYVEIAGAAF